VAGSADITRTAQACISTLALARAPAMSTSDVFRRIVTALEEAGIAYMLSGSFASASYGAPRSTQDIDLVIEASAKELRNFVEALPRDEYYADLDSALEAHDRKSLFNVIDLKTGWKIDLIILKERAFSRVEFGRRQVINVHELRLFVATPEDIIIAKLEWSKLGQSRRQLEDVAAILRSRGESLDYPYVERWLSELDLHNEWSEARREAGL
jgi:hypothetical protein